MDRRPSRSWNIAPSRMAARVICEMHIPAWPLFLGQHCVPILQTPCYRSAHHF
jgi:hypothetical protein